MKKSEPTGICVKNPSVGAICAPVLLAKNIDRVKIRRFVEEMCRGSWGGSCAEELLESELEQVDGVNCFIAYIEDEILAKDILSEYIDILDQLGIPIEADPSQTVNSLFSVD